MPFDTFNHRDIQVIQHTGSRAQLLLWNQFCISAIIDPESISLIWGWPTLWLEHQNGKLVAVEHIQNKFQNSNMWTIIDRSENTGDFDHACRDPNHFAAFIVDVLEKRIGPKSQKRIRTIQYLTDLASIILHPEERPVHLHLIARVIEGDEGWSETFPPGSLCSRGEILEYETLFEEDEIDKIEQNHTRLSHIDPLFGAEQVINYLGEALIPVNTRLYPPHVFCCEKISTTSNHDRMHMLTEITAELEPFGFNVEKWAKMIQ